MWPTRQQTSPAQVRQATGFNFEAATFCGTRLVGTCLSAASANVLGSAPVPSGTPLNLAEARGGDGRSGRLCGRLE